MRELTAGLAMVAVPEDRVPVPSTVTPSLNVTVPVARPPVTATVAVKVTAEPYAAVAPREETKLVVLVVTGPTVTVPVPVK